MAQLWGCCCCVVLVLLHTASPGPSPSCLLSFYTSSGLALLSQSFEDGAELLDSSLVQDFRECLSRCCGMPECQLALWMQTPVQGKRPCLLVNCLAANEPVCTFAPREGPQASTRFPGTYRNIQPPPAPQVDCLSPPKTGPCRASFSRWFYNASSKTCNEFTYGGCLSNGNNYRSELECWNYCNGVTEPGSNSVPVASRSTSSLKDCSGPCTASQFQCADGCCVSRHLLCDGTTRCADKSDEDYCQAVRDSYDQLIKKQDPGPQVNVRDSYDQLIKKQDPGPQVNERCTAPKKVGSCRAAFPRWYFDTSSRSCREFVYGGCKGNKNNFVSEHQCLVACAGQKEDVPQPHKLQSNTDDKEYCFVPAVTGRCRASFPRWFYNPTSLTCERFVYGGCGGNKNNYPSELACLARCSGKTVPEDNQKGDEDGEVNTQHHVGTPRNIPAISMVIVLSICVLALLGGVIYFIVKLTKPDHTVSYQRAPHRDDKETLISTVQTL